MAKQERERTVRLTLRKEEPTPQQRAAWMRWLASVAEEAAQLTAAEREAMPEGNIVKED